MLNDPLWTQAPVKVPLFSLEQFFAARTACETRKTVSVFGVEYAIRSVSWSAPSGGCVDLVPLMFVRLRKIEGDV
ncbi:hypothetical protein [Paraburkholderia phenoliruptrix]|uniref:hypothetical protein n=1 Tax=Paraburkholderia phenoliruptrix TaxID=252970 RepID=UPI001C6EEA89|nr:hypothetical protein [Paraburkholderia phenoliruptrix]MBW9102924.1 hypothetical protein [Paraburkholderia phenoliruptrix]MBW9132898.1 hypothetical protein [Paraburkholderia ginsengiterrae]